MNFFLKAKNWKIFLLIFIPMLAGSMLDNSGRDLSHDSATEDLFVACIPLIGTLLLFVGTMVNFAWIYALSVGLQSVIREDLRMNVSRFRFFCWLATASFAANLLLHKYGSGEGNIYTSLIIIGVILQMGSVFFLYYFAVKTLCLAQFQRKPSLKDMQDMVWIGCAVFGVWWIQPKVNKLIKLKRIE